MSDSNFIKRYWQIMKRPHRAALGTILALGFTSGVIFWGGFNTGLEATNTEAFCISCHEMENNVYQEYKETIHYSNRSGVRATCPDCHVPDEWTHKIVRKIQASKELWGKFTGYVDTPEKFDQHRKEMAIREWKRMKDNDSQECRNCHNFEYMDFSEQGKRSRVQHANALETGDKTCIDCHKGIAHTLPDMKDVEGWD
ncbi:cytochrome c3 family protein [Aliikangiella sp. G2MR2-5]|uniref:cytochrome c3 family protein n=1 Tax=Aliikangiella sp. G2MR2-5 TaxID=2788943 RepID=UPI0018A91A22|nr:cytochrome c3 family protein [Aliikangiella sp. G2MR2-5]